MLIFGNFILRFKSGRNVPVSRVKTSYWVTICIVLMTIMMIRIYTHSGNPTINDILISFVSASFVALFFSGKVEKIKAFLSNQYVMRRAELSNTRTAALNQAH